MARADHCDVCGVRVDRKQLVRRRHTTLRNIGENLLEHSSYDGTYWSVTAGAFVDYKSCGLKPGETHVAADNTVSITDGSPQFRGSTIGIRSSTLDATGASSIVFSVYAGVDPGSSVTSVTLEIQDAATPASKVSTTFTAQVAAGRRYWMRATAPALTAAGVDIGAFKVAVSLSLGSANDTGWIDGAQVEKDTESPTRLIMTSGAAISWTAPQVQSGYVKMCPRCAAALRPLKYRTRLYQRLTKRRPDPPIRTDPR